MKSLRKSKKVLLPEYYSGIDDLPILKWEKVHETGSVKHLLVKPCELSQVQISALTLIWNSIYEEYIQEFGFSEQYKSIIDLRLKIAKLQMKKVISGDDSIDNFIRMHQLKMEAIVKFIKPGDVFKAKKAIETHTGIYLPIKEISVREFCSYLREMNTK